jgi:hypothetical protein
MKGDDIMPGMDGFISFNGTLNGSIEGGSGGDVADVKVRHSQSAEYISVVDSEKIALIDLISYVRRNELSQELMVLKDNFDLKLDYKQNNLIAGDNITLENNVISAKASGVNYSTNEQDTGMLWHDGRHVYQISFIFDRNVNLPTSAYELWFDISTLNIDNIIDSKFVWESRTKGSVNINQCYVQNNRLYLRMNPSVDNTLNSVLTIQYIKTEV